MTRSLRAKLSSDLAGALRMADLLAVSSSGGGVGVRAGGLGGRRSQGGEAGSEPDEERRVEGLARVKVRKGRGGRVKERHDVRTALVFCFVVVVVVG